MTVIELSLIPDADADDQTIERLMLDFKRDSNLIISIQPFTVSNFSPEWRFSCDRFHTRR